MTAKSKDTKKATPKKPGPPPKNDPAGDGSLGAAFPPRKKG